jgi:antirestriction protein ArdC
MAATTSLPTTHQHTDKPALRDFRQEVTDSIVGMLERGVAPWQKPWEPGASSLDIPFNPTSVRAYRGGNAIHLMATGLERGYEDPRWMTYKQASDNGWQVRRGEKGTQVEYWEARQAADKTQPTGPDGGGDGSTADGNAADAEKSRFIHRVYTVFNARQIEGIPPHTPKQHTTFEVVQAGEQILKNSGANIAHDQADRAFYSRSQDSIHLPPKDAFKDAAGYYGTALHELAHWSGHSSRLDRPTLTESYRFGDVNYAKEELRAELASIFLAAQRGIPHNPEQHAAYVNSWIGALKRDKNEIFRAAHDASKATDFILALERDKSIGEEDLVSGPVLTPRASGSSPAAMLEQETEEIHHDRERVDEKESNADLSTANSAILETTIANEHAAPARESTQYAARYEPGSGTVNVHAKGRRNIN